MAFSSRVYGLGVMALGLFCLVCGDFYWGLPVPKNFPERTALAFATGAFLVVAGGAVQWQRAAASSAAALSAYYALIVVLVMFGHVALTHYAEFGTYSGAAEQLAIAAGGLIIYASRAGITAPLSVRLALLGQRVFGICAVLFGGAHFFYLNLTVPLIPTWLPPDPKFWAYATGIGHIAAGVAILTGVQARLAGVLLTMMYASFTLLVHLPMLFADPSSKTNWSENALNLALIGVAWVVADSTARK